MKKLLITAIVIAVMMFSYNKYRDYKRFNGPQTNYEAHKSVDLNYHNQTTLFNYQSSISSLNGFVKTQWSAHGIDIINPEKETEQIQFASNTYTQKLARVKHYESFLIQSTQLKEKSFSNKDIKLFEKTGLTENEYRKKQREEKLTQIIQDSYNGRVIRMGEKSPLIFEVQKLLNKSGFNIKNDGVYQNETSIAIKAFETKHNLFPDGKLDSISLEYLLSSN